MVLCDNLSVVAKKRVEWRVGEEQLTWSCARRFQYLTYMKAADLREIIMMG